MTKPNNRWAIVYPWGVMLVLHGDYLNADDVLTNCKSAKKSWVRYIPKSAYHPVADGALDPDEVGSNI